MSFHQSLLDNTDSHLRTNEYTSEVRKMTREEKQDLCEIWESIFTEVVDVECKEMFIRLFEDENQCYLINFDGTTRINSIEDWK